MCLDRNQESEPLPLPVAPLQPEAVASPSRKHLPQLLHRASSTSSPSLLAALYGRCTEAETPDLAVPEASQATSLLEPRITGTQKEQ